MICKNTYRYNDHKCLELTISRIVMVSFNYSVLGSLDTYPGYLSENGDVMILC